MPLGQNAIDRFIEMVSDLNENQYGDFMRRTNLYLFRLQEALGKTSASHDAVFAQIRARLLFQTDFQIDTTRRFVLEKARSLAR